MRINFLKDAISGIFGSKGQYEVNNTEKKASPSVRAVTSNNKLTSQDTQKAKSFDSPKKRTLKQRLIKSFKRVLNFFSKNKVQTDNLQINLNSSNDSLTTDDKTKANAARVIAELQKKFDHTETAKEHSTSATSIQKNFTATELINNSSNNSSKKSNDDNIYEKPIIVLKNASTSDHVYKKPRPSDKKNATENNYNKLNFQDKNSGSDNNYDHLEFEGNNSGSKNIYDKIIPNTEQNTSGDINHLKKNTESSTDYKTPRSTPKPKTE